MVEERGYERRVAVQAGTPLPQVSADAFGAGVGREIERAGEIIHTEKLEDARIDRELRDNSEWSRWQVAYAQSREEFDRLAADSRESDDPGHAKALAEAWRVREQELLQGLTSERLKERASASMADWGGAYRTREAVWEQARQAEITVDRYDEGLRASEARVRRLETPDDYAAEVTIQMDAIGGLAVSDEIRDKLMDETEQRLAIAYLRGTIDRDPALAKGILGSNAFDGILTGDQIEALTNGADVEIRRVEAANARVRAEKEAQLREQLQTFEEAESQGFFTDPAEFDQAIEAARAIGDTSLALKLEGMQADTAFIRVWGPENATSLQREQRMTVLAGKANRSIEETRELEFLRRNAASWASEEQSDPVGQAARRGGDYAPPAIDFSDPATLLARGRWAAARTAAGQPVSPLTRTEAQTLGRIFDSGAQGREQVLGLLAEFQPAQAMAAARMMDPEDRTLPVIATLNPRQRTTALRGREILADNRKFLEERLAGNALDVESQLAVGQGQLNQALQAVPFEERTAIMLAAQELMAGSMERAGGEWNEQSYVRAINFVLGATGSGEEQKGGLSQWGGRAFLLPEGVSKRAFVNATVAGARESEDPPVNPDGSLARLSRAYPVVVGPGQYEFHTATGRPLVRRSGEIYRVNVRAR